MYVCDCGCDFAVPADDRLQDWACGHSSQIGVLQNGRCSYPHVVLGLVELIVKTEELTLVVALILANM